MSVTTSRGFAPWLEAVLRALIIGLFALAGAMKLTLHPFETEAFAHFGYASWFMFLIGAIEFFGAFALLRRPLIMPTLALFAAVLVGAIVSHAHAGDPPIALIPPAALLLMVASVAVLRVPLGPGLRTA